jgi:VTC domain
VPRGGGAGSAAGEAGCQSQRDASASALQMKADMLAQGRQPKDVDAVEPLFRAVQQKVHSALLRPTVRTQYQRTAFQIPFDATVRISLDTKLRLYKELPDIDNPLWGRDWGHTPRPSAGAVGPSPKHLRARTAGRSNAGAAASEMSSESGADDSIEFLAWCAARCCVWLPRLAAVLSWPPHCLSPRTHAALLHAQAAGRARDAVEAH